MRFSDDEIRSDARKAQQHIYNSCDAFNQAKNALWKVYSDLEEVAGCYQRLDPDQRALYLELHRFAMNAFSLFGILSELYHLYQRECSRLESEFLERYDVFEPIHPLFSESEEVE